jgi:hypothetical protein
MSTRLGGLALRALNDFAPNAATLAYAVGSSRELSETVYPRVIEKLNREPVEDFRIDFEDGYGNRPDDEEDATALSAAAEVAKGLAAGTLPPFLGIRIKPLNDELKARGFRTLHRFLDSMLEKTGGRTPANFVVTLQRSPCRSKCARWSKHSSRIRTFAWR